jgi:hypothetical protein
MRLFARLRLDRKRCRNSLSKRFLYVATLVAASLVFAACTTADGPTAPTPTATAVEASMSTPTPTPVLATPSPTATTMRARTPTSTPTTVSVPLTPTPTAVPVLPTPTPSPTSQREPAGCVSNTSPVLTAHVTDLTMLDFISPMIVASGNWLKNRSYLTVGRDDSGQVYEAPVYAPVGSTLKGITYYLQPMLNEANQWVDVPQYSLRFELSCEVEYEFDHLEVLSPALAAIAPTEPATTTRNAEKRVSLALEAGELIGHTTGTMRAHTWDWVFINQTKTPQFANQQRYDLVGDLAKLRHADCPYDYYAGTMGQEYFDLFGGFNVTQTGATECPGSPDLLGTISGGWFQQSHESDGSATPGAGWGIAVVLGADNVVHVNGENWTVRAGLGQSSFADPKTVTTEHCYEHYSQPISYAYLQLRSDTEMAVAHGDGNCPAQFPSNHQVFYR